MQKFTYHMPTKVVFGKDAELSAADEIKACGGTRVMLVYGGGSAVKSGLIGRLERLLDEAGLPHTSLSGVQPNPRLSLAREGVRQALDFKADFILAAGGGSVIDTAKAVAHGAANPGVDIWRFWTREAALARSIPVGAVPTIPAAGSETSDSAVLTNDGEWVKRGLNTPLNRPRFAAMNPEFLHTLPKYQIACSVVDIMMHTLDRYFTPTEGNATTDALAEALLRVVIAHGETALADPDDYGAMSELMWCGSLSHNGITGLGAAADFAVHQLGHELSGKFDVAHGASLSSVWGAWARYCCPVKPARFARYAEQVWGIRESDAEHAAQAGIARTVAYFAGLGMPTSFTELGIGVQDDAELRKLADSCVFHGKRTIGQFRVLNGEDAYRIYTDANR
jgi:alcohol dehydrogenase YqhD (iron-dependent ADH family)